jgi:hypothetical protein
VRGDVGARRAQHPEALPLAGELACSQTRSSFIAAPRPRPHYVWVCGMHAETVTVQGQAPAHRSLALAALPLPGRGMLRLRVLRGHGVCGPWAQPVAVSCCHYSAGVRPAAFCNITAIRWECSPVLTYPLESA